MKALRLFALLAFLAGVSLLGRAAYLHAKAELAGVLIRRAWAASLQSGRPQAPWPWADTHPIARLRIPRLGYDEMVLEGATPRTLAFGPARLMSGVRPGEPGNLVLAGHRTSWFKPLAGVQVGDVVTIEWHDDTAHALRRREYRVSAIEIATPDQVTLLAPTVDDALTLVTCYPFGASPASPQRFVVRAEPAEPSRVLKAPVARSRG